MSESEWVNATSWCKSDTAEDRKTPRTWELRIGVLRLIVTRHRMCESNEWLLRCYPEVCTETIVKGDVSAEVAQAALLRRVRRWLELQIADLDRFMEKR